MKIAVLQIEPLMPEIQSRLEASYTTHKLFEATDPDALIKQVAPNVRAIVTGGGSGASRTIVDALPKLEIIAINGVGTDAVDLEQARGRGVRVTNTPDVLTEDVADLGMALLLAVERQICVGDRFVREGRWTRKEALPLARSATRKKLGILGMGRIGRTIARRAQGFDMTIAYSDLRAFDDLPYRYVADLVQLARESDILIVAASGGPQSRGIINAPVLDALGSQGVLVNVARGTVVDEPALVAALIEGRIGGAGLDVFAHEPDVPEVLFKLDNVVLQPHRASATVETRLAMGELVVGNLAAHFGGKELLTAVV
jgi:lactate dehydrogenase-like 2-hydroxyacid dehydrogenase